MGDTPLNWKSARLLPSFYDGVARSLAGQSANRFQITTFRFGYGYVDMTTEPPTLEALPQDMLTVPDVFFSGTPTMAYINGRLMIRCHMPLNSIAAPVHYALTGLYDQDDTLVAVTQDIPLWLSPLTRHTTYVYIDFPNVTANPPQFFEGDCE